jgi:hypothetical protein
MHLVRLDKSEAALQLAKLRAQEILAANLDPFGHLGDFEHLWLAADYCRELSDYGNLVNDVFVARCMEQPEQEIRAWLMERLRKLAAA